MKDKILNWLGFLGVILIITLPISFTHALSNCDDTCRTRGRYLPVTYLFCKLSEPIHVKK